jgi:short subunit dehydrogenase-like uncharacterized protein
MPEVLVFGATGYTGRLTAHALARRGSSFAIAGRNREKLEALAKETGYPEIRIAQVGDTDSLARALDDVRVLITCVGPFVELGDTAVEAAIRARTHYVDSTGEGAFIGRLAEQRDADARAAGIVMAPAMGFDEVPSDVAATMASEGLDRPDVVLTYAVPATFSVGTLKSALGILTTPGQWISDGGPVPVRTGDHERWAPMPPPLGPRLSVSAPLASGYIVPLHLTLSSLRVYTTTGRIQRTAMRAGLPMMRVVQRASAGRAVIGRIAGFLPDGPTGDARKAKWTVLAEARSGSEWRNVAVVGSDMYGLTGELLAAAALTIAADDYDRSGVLAPVDAVGLESLQKTMNEQGVAIDTFPG